MKTLLGVVFALALGVGSVPLAAADDEKPKTPPPAVVTMTGTISGMSRLAEKKMELRLSPAKGGDIMTAPRVLVDEDKAKVNPIGRETIAFEGKLATTDVVIGHTGSVPGRNITAKALSLIADKATVITDDNKAKFPPAGTARVEGKGLNGKFDAGKGVETAYAIENGEQPILLLDKDGKPLEIKKLPATVSATGKVRVGEKGVLILDAETVEESKGEK